LFDADQGAFMGAVLGCGPVFLRGFTMSRLMMTLFSMVATTLMGVGVVIALTTGYGTLNPILIAAAVGFVLAFPISWFVAKQLE
jgi:predicted PurR-regulated permease PerM